MRKRVKFTIPTKYILIFLTVLCTGFIVLTLMNANVANPVRDGVSKVLTPIQKGINHIGLWISDKAENLKEISDLQAEIDKLKEEVDTLKTQNRISYQNENELQRYREMYKLDNVYSDYDKIAAKVISADPGNWLSYFVIDKGSKDGIVVDMNVIGGTGLVGRVVSVGDNYAKVSTIINDDSNVRSEFSKTSDLCIVQGDLTLMDTGLIRVKGINIDADISEEDMIETSNISDKYVPGILIGYVTQIEDDGNKLTKSAYLRPAVDFSKIKEVLVITQLKVTGE